MRFRRILGIENNLSEAIVIAKVDEDKAAVVTPAVHPTGKGDPLTSVGRPQLSTGMGLEHVLVILNEVKNLLQPAKRLSLTQEDPSLR